MVIIGVMAKKKQIQDAPEWQRYAGALLEDINSKFEIVLESTKDIPAMKEQINHIMTWEDDVKMIPVMFEEIGHLREDVELIKEKVISQ